MRIQADNGGPLEVAFWTGLVLTPVLCWVNGPAVSADQMIVRSAVVATAACGVMWSVIAAWRRRCHP